MSHLLLRTLLLLLLSSTTLLSAQHAEVYASRKGAIEGYDPVAYFREGKAVPGTSTHTYVWKGATWRFANAANLEAFKARPEAYAPQYGGYCAYAVANGYTAQIDPQAWKIVDGKLYLNYNPAVQKDWEAQQADFIRQADSNWPSVLTKK
ncbi:MAG: YHS domain-containing (seleno)protein [Bacteroidia bacterium]